MGGNADSATSRLFERSVLGETSTMLFRLLLVCVFSVVRLCASPHRHRTSLPDDRVVARRANVWRIRPRLPERQYFWWAGTIRCVQFVSLQLTRKEYKQKESHADKMKPRWFIKIHQALSLPSSTLLYLRSLQYPQRFFAIPMFSDTHFQKIDVRLRS